MALKAQLSDRGDQTIRITIDDGARAKRAAGSATPVKAARCSVDSRRRNDV
jgi:hypothetical protein